MRGLEEEGLKKKIKVKWCCIVLSVKGDTTVQKCKLFTFALNFYNEIVSYSIVNCTSNQISSFLYFCIVTLYFFIVW